MAPRAAVLTALALLASGCLKPPKDAARVPACGGCHEPHYTAQARCEECHRGDPAAVRKELGHARLLTGGAAEHALPDGPVVREGRQLVERLACRRCHTIAAEGNRLSTELDAVVWKREQAQLTASITQPVENMPDFGLEPRQVEAAIAYLLSAGSRDKPLDSYRVHFERAAADRTSVFEDKCGGCHRFLSPLGARGRGSAGPNLSGLFTRFYPHTAPGDQPWTEKALAEWLRNPRHVRPATTMPPIALSGDELRRVTEELSEVRGGAARAAHLPADHRCPAGRGGARADRPRPQARARESLGYAGPGIDRRRRLMEVMNA